MNEVEECDRHKDKIERFLIVEKSINLFELIKG
jgi:hypothetical protein